jgi:hypothetical protein
MDNIINFIISFADSIGYIGVYIYMFLVGNHAIAIHSQ